MLNRAELQSNSLSESVENISAHEKKGVETAAVYFSIAEYTQTHTHTHTRLCMISPRFSRRDRRTSSSSQNNTDQHQRLEYSSHTLNTHRYKSKPVKSFRNRERAKRVTACALSHFTHKVMGRFIRPQSHISSVQFGHPIHSPGSRGQRSGRRSGRRPFEVPSRSENPKRAR